MKKLSIVIAVFLLVFLTLPTMGQPQLGIVAGVNLANASIDPSEGANLSNRTGFAVGAVAVFPLSPMLAIQLEPTYMQKGAGYDVQTEIYDEENNQFIEGKVEGTLKADYIDIPVLVKLSFGESTTKPYIMAGPYLGFLLSAKNIFDKFTPTGGSAITIDEEQDIKDETKSTDFGLNFGAGVSFPMGNNTLMLEAMYSLGLSNINDDSEDPDTKIKNKGIQIKAGITFPLGQ
jgi:hypothetical protein